jgi:hypothetical protein
VLDDAVPVPRDDGGTRPGPHAILNVPGDDKLAGDTFNPVGTVIPRLETPEPPPLPDPAVTAWLGFRVTVATPEA